MLAFVIARSTYKKCLAIARTRTYRSSVLLLLENQISIVFLLLLFRTELVNVEIVRETKYKHK